MSYFDPVPKFEPELDPEQEPAVVVPSYIGKAELVGNWLFYNGAGDKLYDFSGEGNHGDIRGPKWTDEGIASWALKFDGVDDYVEIPVIQPHPEITFLAWVKLEPVGSTRHVASGGYDGTNTAWELKWLNTEELQFGSFDGYTHTTAAVSVSTGEWHHVAGLYDDADEDWRLYVDGTLESEVSDATGALTSDVTWNAIGCHNKQGSTVNFVSGTIDEPRIYDRALSQNEVKEIYRKTKPLYIG